MVIGCSRARSCRSIRSLSPAISSARCWYGFGAGFVLGTIRVLLVAPQLDENAAVLLETPIMLIASWYVCRWAVERLHVPRTVLVRSVMGIVGFAVLTLAELSLATFVFGRSAPVQLQTYATAAG